MNYVQMVSLPVIARSGRLCPGCSKIDFGQNLERTVLSKTGWLRKLKALIWLHSLPIKGHVYNIKLYEITLE